MFGYVKWLIFSPQNWPIFTPQLTDFLHYLSELLLRHTENFVISPEYWNKFDENKQNSLIKFFNETATNPKIQYNPDLHYIFELVD